MTSDFPEMHKTGYPPGRGKYAREYQDLYSLFSACFCNLDAPEWILTGSTFYGPLCKDALAASAPRDGFKGGI